MDVGTVSIQRDPRKSKMCEYLAHKANLLGMKNSLMRIKLGSHKNLTSEFKDFSRTFQGFPEPKCHYFQLNILASKGATIQLLGVGGGGGDVGAVFELNKLFISFLICRAVFFHILSQAKYLFHLKKNPVHKI